MSGLRLITPDFVNCFVMPQPYTALLVDCSLPLMDAFTVSKPYMHPIYLPEVK